MMNIYEKLAAITDELGAVAKTLEVEVSKNNKYKAVCERDIIDAVKPLEKKHRVYSFPVSRTILDSQIIEKERTFRDETTKTKSMFMRIETIYRFVNLDDPKEYVETTVYGDGIDTGDKAPGKAMTYADKYALMKAYKISTGDDPDRDDKSEREAEVPAFVAAAPKGEQPTVEDVPFEEAEPEPTFEKKREMVAGLYDGVGGDEKRAALFAKYHVTSWDEMPAASINGLYAKAKAGRYF